MKYLVTGIAGFVGQHLAGQLVAQGHEIVGVDAHDPREDSEEHLRGVSFHKMSLMDQESLKSIIEKTRPDRVVHLASASSVGLSWERPSECFVNNTNIFLNLIEAVRACGISCRILSVGSSEEYGPVTVKDIPLKEDRPANPVSPYAVARVAQEHLSSVFSKGYGMDIVCTRSFNHLGPWQRDRFVVSSFVHQAVEVARKKRKSITCGELNIIRDFIDVRDVIQAYGCILDKGLAGEIYNVCSGQGVTLQEILERICHKLKIPASWEMSPALIRPVDTPVIVGDNTKLKRLGFKPVYGLDRSLDDMIAWWSGKAL